MEAYRLSIKEVVEQTQCNPKIGLTTQEVRHRQQKEGLNELAAKKQKTWF